MSAPEASRTRDRSGRAHRALERDDECLRGTTRLAVEAKLRRVGGRTARRPSAAVAPGPGR
ncbi:hypothetical protein AB0L40_11060 [Patulibacter sp. NPDC049589]|uniref:hypothetical protein n=1 Tax=Patulibacter sp. NPDC049589 TaxID=3154731 RepID=UPI003435B98E